MVMRGTARKSAPKVDRATNQVDDLMQFYSEAYTEVYPRGKSGAWFDSEPRLIIYQSKHAARVLDNALGQYRTGRVPRQARGGGFGQCEVSRRVNPLYQGKHAARVLDNDLSLHRTGRVPK